MQATTRTTIRSITGTYPDWVTRGGVRMTDRMKSIALIWIGAVTVVVSYGALIYAAVAV